MSQYKVHIYIIEDERDGNEQEIYVWREHLQTGKYELLRNGECSWPEAIAKTCVQVNVPTSMYSISPTDADKNAWEKATPIPETDW